MDINFSDLENLKNVLSEIAKGFKIKILFYPIPNKELEGGEK